METDPNHLAALMARCRAAEAAFAAASERIQSYLQKHQSPPPGAWHAEEKARAELIRARRAWADALPRAPRGDGRAPPAPPRPPEGGEPLT